MTTLSNSPQAVYMREYRKRNPEKHREREKKYQQNNKEKCAARQAAWRVKNREKLRLQKRDNRNKNLAAYREHSRRYMQSDKGRENYLTRTFGITLEQYNSMFVSQGGVCAICESESKNKRLHVDHCHSTGVVRGLLCWRCNVAIGVLRDNAETAAMLAKYLEISP